MKPKRKTFKMKAWAVVDERYIPEDYFEIFFKRFNALNEIRGLPMRKILPVTITERGKAEWCSLTKKTVKLSGGFHFLVETECGRVLNDDLEGYKFCPKCGNKIKVMKGRG